MNWLWAILVGLVLGVLARAILPGKQDIPIWLTAIFGILGSVLGNAVAGWVGVDDTKGIDWMRHVLQLVGAVVVVGIGTPLWAMVKGKGKRATRGT
ncbi:GlsB/YeaQ/YmgE family stress response membrane protein [Streptomyces sp. Z26]|uniref:GlsB/YeaQ/YmgE family stress response membrane protein n=1 Tax=Streptomyces TaxID=1883 RepID=UPI000EF16CBF|nr:GlsB/YeaQ/YmgE family stress response membrane protein [Streptomyces sp. Z26]RLL66184.1 GlsB/YeaQ/YmgE family stress response membrane protein [Streptomyces sp. Z26]